MLNKVAQSLLGTFGFMGIEKIYFQLVLFLSTYLNEAMNITHTLLSKLDFTFTLTFYSIPYLIIPAVIGYDGSGGYVFSIIFGLSSIHSEQ